MASLARSDERTAASWHWVFIALSLGKPVAEVIPPSPAQKGRKFVGSGIGSFDILDNDIVGPIIDFNEMEVLNQHRHSSKKHSKGLNAENVSKN